MSVENIDPLALILFLSALSLLPLLVIIGTSFVKISIVFSLIRNALGIQQIPPNMALHALALIMTMYIMAPVGLRSYDNITSEPIALDNFQSIERTFKRGLQPYKEFLKKHTSDKELDFFVSTARTLWATEFHVDIHKDNMIILLPSFIVGELTVAFEIGFLVYLPFIVIDLVVSNILMAMGMMMMSPTTISLPFKLLLFVFLDGWTRLVHGLVLSYQ